MSKISKDRKEKNAIKKTVIESIQGVLRDPDYGKEIKHKYAQKLERIRTEKPKKTTSLKNIKKKYL